MSSALDTPIVHTPIVRLRGIAKNYGASIAVEDLDLDIGRGEFFTFLGPSGSGKTTTLRMIAGFEYPDRGVIELDGADVAQLPPFARDVNTVFQDYALFPHMTLLQNVAYGLEAHGMTRRQAAPRAAEALEMVKLGEFGDRKPGQLSGGQRQRVALARAIVNRPRVLLLDEPLGALDLKLRHEMQIELKRIQRDVGITFLYVTHDQDEALTMSDRVAVFSRGRVEQVGTPAEIYERPATEFVAGFVGVTNRLERGGKRLFLRPEKIHVSDRADPRFDGFHTEDAVVREVIYGGMSNRILLDLSDGNIVTAVQINAGLFGSDAAMRPGRRVCLAWRPEHAFEIAAANMAVAA